MFTSVMHRYHVCVVYLGTSPRDLYCVALDIPRVRILGRQINNLHALDSFPLSAL